MLVRFLSMYLLMLYNLKMKKKKQKLIFHFEDTKLHRQQPVDILPSTDGSDGRNIGSFWARGHMHDMEKHMR